eukprot:gene1022-343_t
MKELEELETITRIHHTMRVHNYYKKLARIVRTLVTMKRLDSTQLCLHIDGQTGTSEGATDREGDENTEEEKLPVYTILGAADDQRIKTTELPVLGTNPDVDPGAESTVFGRTVTRKTMETDAEVEIIFMMLSPKEEFEKMCSIEVLGLADTDS